MRRPAFDSGPARTLHPGAWWLWAIALAVVASRTTNPLVLGLVIGVAALVVAARREDAPWAFAFRMYVLLGAAIIVIRVAFRLAFGGAFGTHLLVELPEIPLPEWLTGIRIGGPVTAESIVAAFYDGLRLAALVICFGAANSLANPKRLLRVLPNALFEAGAAVTVAMSVAPQLVDSLLRVGRARRLRGGADGVRGRQALLMPVLEDALDRSISLAAAMDARGYGRTAGVSRAARRTTSAMLLLGLAGVAIGLYGLLDATAPLPLAAPILLVGLALLVAGLAASGRREQRTRYRPDRWGRPEWLLAATGGTAVVLTVVGAAVDPASLHPSLVPLEWPALALLPTIGLLAAALPAWLTPASAERPRPASAQGRHREPADGLAPGTVRS